MAKQLSVYKQLTGGVKFLDETPLTSTGKVRRKELKELAKSFQSESKFTIENNVLKGEVKPISCEYTSVGQFLFDKLTENEKLVGQVDSVTGKEKTFGQILDRSIRCALWMRKQGIQQDDVVMLSTHNHLDTVVPLYAALFNGVAINCLNDGLRIREYQHILSIVKPKLAFVSENCAQMVAGAAKAINMSMNMIVFGNIPDMEAFSQILERQDSEEVDNFRCIEVTDSKRTAVILCTSGTTGMPKGVMMSHFGILNQFLNVDWKMSNRIMLMLSSLHWLSGIIIALFTGLLGNKGVVVPYFREELISSAIDKFKVQWSLLPPTVINQLLKSDIWTRYDFSSLEIVLTGGEVIRQESLDKLSKHLPHATIARLYGMSELGGVITFEGDHRKQGSCGVALYNVEIKVVDVNTGKVLGPNCAGEVYVRCPSTMVGYYGDPEATKDTVDSEGWVHSGDLAFYNESGELVIVERIKELIKYRYHQVSPSEVESVIIEHPGVKEVVVVAVPHPVDIERPMAFVTRVPGANVTEEELMDMVAKQLSASKRLTGGVKFLDEMPYTPAGKLERKVLRARARSFAVDA